MLPLLPNSDGSQIRVATSGTHFHLPAEPANFNCETQTERSKTLSKEKRLQ